MGMTNDNGHEHEKYMAPVVVQLVANDDRKHPNRGLRGAGGNLYELSETQVLGLLRLLSELWVTYVHYLLNLR